MNCMKDESSSPESEHAGDNSRNDANPATAESDKPRGKRRTAREIATMFEQLKHRHILRKKEWMEEKHTLMKKLKMAEESKNVLSELKEILENLREELRQEERKRLQMELDHLNDKRKWETEKAEFLKKIEERTHESDRDEKGLRKMSEKIMEQATTLNELQGTEIELKRQLLEKDRRCMREKKELHLEFEKERSIWRNKEQELNRKLRQFSLGKSSSSSLSPSPGNLPNPTRDFIKTEDDAQYDDINQERAKNGEKPSSYSNFERKVDDALKQIERIRTDFSDYRRESDSFHTQSSDFKTSASPSPLPGSMSNPPPSSVPWRSRQRNTTLNHQQFNPETKAGVLSESFESLSPTDATISLPSMSKVRKLTPNPDRKFKKIHGHDRKTDISQMGGSADAYNYTDQVNTEGNRTESSQRREKGVDPSSTRIESAQGNRDLLIDSLDDDSIHAGEGLNSAIAQECKHRSLENRNAIITKKEKSPIRSSSPRLPRLHQQLLFKRDPSLPFNLSSNDKSSTSDFVSANDSTYSDKVLQPQPLKDHVSTHTPYFDPCIGYAKGYRPPKKKASATNYTATEGSSAEHHDHKQTLSSITVSPTITSNSGMEIHDAALAKHKVTDQKDDSDSRNYAPAVQPKPKVSIHKDDDGNIIHVSPAIDKFSNSPEIVTPQKQYSIAERMGKVGRDWIKRKLNFKEKIPDENASEMTRRISDKKKGKQKHRRPSSWLRNKRDSGSISTSEESSDGETRRRESFLRRHKRKGKSSSNTSNSESPTKPKKYTRSKTDASPKDMKKFLSKFKLSPSNSKKPSVVQQFEKKLLENDIWTLKEEDGTVGSLHANMESNINTPSKPLDLGDDVLDTLQNKIRDTSPSVLYNDVKKSYRQRKLDESCDEDVYVTKLPNKYNESSLSQTAHAGLGSSNHGTKRQGRPKSYSEKKSSSDEDGNDKNERLTVSRLVNRFSSNLDTDRKEYNPPTLQPSKRKSSNRHMCRSHSLTTHDGRKPQVTEDVFKEGLIFKHGTPQKDGFTWHDRIIAISESDDDNVDGEGPLHATKSLRKKFESLSNFWQDKHSNENVLLETTSIPRKAKTMSDEMKQKTNMLQSVLSTGPKKPRRYRRADTQPVAWTYESEDDQTSTTSGETSEMFNWPNVNTSHVNDAKLGEFGNQGTDDMHETIPSVTGKFNKPSKPGRLPSRWAR